jgi:adenine phosphoribosyltransferase
MLDSSLSKAIREVIRDIPDFPKPGILFRDITPLLARPVLCNELIAHLANDLKDWNVEAVMGIESRGFIFGMPLALKLGVPFVPVRKQGKLPHLTVSASYKLEYGEATIEMHQDGISPGQRVLIHDDVLATGGTASAAAELVEKCRGELVGYSFLVELSMLNGRERIQGTPIHTLLEY